MAQFVARNGPEFEQMTKEKQRDNPRFYFLFGGEFFNYYQYRVTSEQAVIRKKQDLQQQQIPHLPIGQQFMHQPLMGSGAPQQPPIWQNNGINNMPSNTINTSIAPPSHQPNLISQQLNDAKEQIRQSEANLAAQHQVFMQQQQIMIDDAIKQAQEEKLRRMSEDFNVNLNEFENVLQPIADNCTKESIAVCIHLIPS